MSPLRWNAESIFWRKDGHGQKERRESFLLPLCRRRKDSTGKSHQLRNMAVSGDSVQNATLNEKFDSGMFQRFKGWCLQGRENKLKSQGSRGCCKEGLIWDTFWRKMKWKMKSEARGLWKKWPCSSEPLLGSSLLGWTGALANQEKEPACCRLTKYFIGEFLNGIGQIILLPRRLPLDL